MRNAGRSGLRLALAVAAVSSALPASSAGAQTPEFVVLGQGAFPSLASTWQGLAVTPNNVFLDLYDSKGTLYQTYMALFDQPPPKRRMNAFGYRPLGLPTVAALVAGAAGTRVKTVKIFFAGAPTQKLATVRPPPEWGFAGRFFAAGTNVAESSASTTQVVTQIKALDGRGRLLSKLTNVFTDPF
jgi:hypothetical protein